MPQPENPVSPASSISSSYANLFTRNERYIKEVKDSSRIVLRHVVEDLLPDDQLKHVPVRTYFRIISAAMFILKVSAPVSNHGMFLLTKVEIFALGGKQNEVAISLQLLDDTVRALRTSVVDDVHLCLRIADLLERLTSSIRPSFVRLPPRSLSIHEQARRTAHQNLENFDGDRQTLPQSSRLSYGANPGDAFPNALAGIPSTYNNPHDNNIAIMPPVGNNYINANYQIPPANAGSPNQQYAQPTQQQQQYPMSSGSNDFSLPSEEDWLTLDLNPLLDPSSLGSNENPWFGAFGPETHNNLEVLGKFVNDQYRPDTYEDGGMGF